MGQVAITLNDRTYRLVCDDGEEDRLVDLAGIVKAKIETLRAEVGHVGDERLMLMAALLIADELVEARAAAAQPGRGDVEALTPVRRTEQLVAPEPEPVQRLRAVATKLSSADIASGDGSASVQATPASKSRRRDVA
jgi:cell division protein ZapA